MKEKKSKIQGNAANMSRSNSISGDTSSNSLIENTLKADNIISESSEASNVNAKNEEIVASEVAK